jgi:hypothetical protein
MRLEAKGQGLRGRFDFDVRGHIAANAVGIGSTIALIRFADANTVALDAAVAPNPPREP